MLTTLDGMPARIETTADVRQFFDALLAAGISFHPDTPFEEYVDHDGAPSFSPWLTLLLALAMRDSFALLGDEVYSVGLAAMQAIGAAPVADGP